ncbi:hypothetical protein TNCV_772941 [Trichonephila clavipes]|nr:hypothetical protein TNCV_772941 [Trichonephila clavipes]
MERTRNPLPVSSNVREIDHYDSEGLMVGIIPLDGRTHHYGNVYAVRYRDEIFGPYVHLLTGEFGPDFFCNELQSEAHRTHLVDQFLESEDIR